MLHRQVPCVAHVLGQLVATFSKVDHLSVTRGPCILEGDGHHRMATILPPISCCRSAAFIWGSGSVYCFCTRRHRRPEEMVTDVFPALHLIWLDEGNDDDGI